MTARVVMSCGYLALCASSETHHLWHRNISQAPQGLNFQISCSPIMRLLIPTIHSPPPFEQFSLWNLGCCPLFVILAFKNTSLASFYKFRLHMRGGGGRGGEGQTSSLFLAANQNFFSEMKEGKKHFVVCERPAEDSVTFEGAAGSNVQLLMHVPCSGSLAPFLVGCPFSADSNGHDGFIRLLLQPQPLPAAATR